MILAGEEVHVVEHDDRDADQDQPERSCNAERPLVGELGGMACRRVGLTAGVLLGGLLAVLLVFANLKSAGLL